MARVARPQFMSFPLRIGADGARRSDRAAHVREQIEQILFTDPGERVFRPEFGAGLRALVFEPLGSPVWAVTQKRLSSALIEALRGEVDPRTLRVEVRDDDGVDAPGTRVIIEVSYTLAALGREERHEIPLGPEAANG